MEKFTLYGARGSHPVAGGRYGRYGGHTTCFSLETDQGMLVVDAGTGLGLLCEELNGRPAIPPITILLTHLHLDHVIGLSAFELFLRKEARITFMTDPALFPGWTDDLRRLFSRPFWPVDPFSAGATVRFEPLPRADGGQIERYGVQVSWIRVRHPLGCLSYKLVTPEEKIIVGTDREHGDAAMDEAFLEFARGADTLLHDGQYTPEDYAEHAGWGHSTWEMAARVAAQARVGRLLLTSHDPCRSDEQIEELVRQARGLFPNTSAAAQGMVLDRVGAWRRD